jgi:alanine racemase
LDRAWRDGSLSGVNAYRVWADIDLDALTHNLAVIRRRAGAGVRIMLVVKADAYGHGAVAVAHHAVRCGVAALGVGSSAEALELRQAGIRRRSSCSGPSSTTKRSTACATTCISRCTPVTGWR